MRVGVGVGVLTHGTRPSEKIGLALALGVLVGIALMFGARLFGRQMAMALGMILLAGAVGLLLI